MKNLLYDGIFLRYEGVNSQILLAANLYLIPTRDLKNNLEMWKIGHGSQALMIISKCVERTTQSVS
ncbi:MAG: hypothetical protein H0U76_28735 [Ktedonobacteraceae bacterium]|nr:hypothetical protein [Ktedonobacteraceae bacterium]